MLIGLDRSSTLLDLLVYFNNDAQIIKLLLCGRISKYGDELNAKSQVYVRTRKCRNATLETIPMK